MSSTTQAMVPVIDFSNQNPKAGSPEWDLVKSQVREALEGYGCFAALFDPILELRKAVFGALQEVFDLPLQTKKLCVSDKPFRGYSCSPSGVFQSMAVDDAHIAENIEQCLTTSLWTQGNISFSKTLASFIQLTSELEKTILKMILESFGLEKYMDELTDIASYQLRIMKYEKPKANEQTIGVPAHCDSNMMTLLYQNEVNGLEIQNKDGEWMNLKLSPNSFIVIIGECLCVWLNGRLSSPYHRVLMKGNDDRYSLGLFATVRGGYMVKVPTELVDDKNPMLFKPHDHEEFLKYFSSEVAKGVVKSGAAISRLKTYCAV
ncbi:probable 2-oxoglutarate-dependent dioxygenase AOP1 [Gossypium arboreum]|uniref:probable 2-oxoglutarate-dependent dioxygenase AOP1 n=1 Tax=Gossypium arboreum TaxID=29729 RepID=UPI0022F1ADE1|nr:probable 2-oxoglutarate-dependent dioxygenase AOP1 [Gossypium arboreum]